MGRFVEEAILLRDLGDGRERRVRAVRDLLALPNQDYESCGEEWFIVRGGQTVSRQGKTRRTKKQLQKTWGEGEGST